MHVKNDLDAYVCLFEECNKPEELYNHSEDWLKHMREHALRWRCISKSHGTLVFDSRAEYEDHMRGKHKGAFTDEQIRVLTERNARTIGPMFTSCPLCGAKEAKGSLEDHIVGHLRSLALKSLPPYYDEEEESPRSEKGSTGTTGPRTRSTIKQELDSFPKPTFDDAGGEWGIWSKDPSTKFVEASLFARVRKPDRRHFEWGFVPRVQVSPTSHEEDPIIQSILECKRDRLNQAKAARKADIERRCQSLTPPIPPNVLRHMESFKAAIQISQQMPDQAWEILKPRLLAQRAAAEQTEVERAARAARVTSIQNRLADRHQQEASLKEVKEVLDREWKDSQKSICDRLSSYADDFIAKEWASKVIDDENSSRFAAELLLYVRQRFYADLAKELDPINRTPPKKLILENMRWVYSNKIKPLIETRKELFLCNGNGCEGTQRLYGFEGVIQHYGAKHTNTFSVGNIVVYWREAEWLEELPFR